MSLPVEYGKVVSVSLSYIFHQLYIDPSLVPTCIVGLGLGYVALVSVSA